MDDVQKFYLYKSIKKLEYIQKSQNPIRCEDIRIREGNTMTYKEKIALALSNNIEIVNSDILLKRNVVGIYEFFGCKEQKEFCFYIGKSTNVAYRLLGSGGGHIYNFLNKKTPCKLVPSEIEKYLKQGYNIKVKIIEVDYKDEYFSRSAHRLALKEFEEIVKYQKMGQCLSQKPEGMGLKEERFWRENYKK